MSNGMVVAEIELSPLSKKHMRKPCKTMNRYHIFFYDNGLRLTVLKRQNMGVTLTGSKAYRSFFKSTPHQPWRRHGRASHLRGNWMPG